MSCCGANPDYHEIDEVSRLVSAKLAAFLRTLRDNGFAVGLHEGRDAASLMAAGYAQKPGLLRIARMVESVRKEELRKVPGVAETLDWAAALVGIGVRDLHDAAETVHETLMCLLKTHEDKSRMTREVTERLLGKVA